MQRTQWILTLLLGVSLHAAASAQQQQPAAGGPPPRPMTLSTTAFPDGAQIPALTWMNTPTGTISFVLHMHDIDVARNKTLDDQAHWVVWNIPGTATGLPEGVPKGETLADGSHQISASGPVYRGPGAPATGPLHHYVFEIIALDTKLDVMGTADAFETRAAVMKALQGHVLGKATYVGLFRRPQ